MAFWVRPGRLTGLWQGGHALQRTSFRDSRKVPLRTELGEGLPRELAEQRRHRFCDVTTRAGRRPTPPRTVRWPPKDGQPTPTLKQARLSHWHTASSSKHSVAGLGRQGVRSAFNPVCLTFDVRGGPLAGRPLDGGVRPHLPTTSHCRPAAAPRARLIFCQPSPVCPERSFL